MDPVFQDRLPFTPWDTPAMARLPGAQPLDPADWLIVDEAFQGQMAIRDALIGKRLDEVHRCLPEAEAAALECLDMVVAACANLAGYKIVGNRATRPDGIEIPLDRERPLMTVGRLIQDDVCILQKHGDEHTLTAAMLCFPASWTLAEKLGKPLTRVHKPVDAYSADMARRVQRLFDALQPGRMLWRANALIYKTPDLFSPRREGEGARDVGADGRYLRSERQVLLRLPRTDAVAFTIHTFMIPLDRLNARQRQTLAQLD